MGKNKKLIDQLKKARTEIIQSIASFPKEKRLDRLFDSWILKDIVAHMTGWDKETADALVDFKNEKEPRFVSDVQRFNMEETDKRREFNWDQAFGNNLSGPVESTLQKNS